MTVGIVGGAFGIRGEVRFTPLLEDPELLCSLPSVELAPPASVCARHRVLAVRRHYGGFVLALEGVDRARAETLRGAEIRILKSEFPPLEEGAWYEWQLLGLAVQTEAGEALGRIEQVHYLPANDVWETPDALIPAIESVLVRVELEQGRVIVRDMAGLRKSDP